MSKRGFTKALYSKLEAELQAMCPCPVCQRESEVDKTGPVGGVVNSESKGVVVEITVEDHTVLLPPEIETRKYTAILTRLPDNDE